MNAFEAPAGSEHSVCPSPEGGPRPRPAGTLPGNKQALKLTIAFSWLTHETFALLSTQPQMGWPLRLRNPRLASLRVFRISGFEKMLVLYTHLSSGVEIVRVILGSRDLVAFLRRERL
jgi:plasmid stabilization system protein ParE